MTINHAICSSFNDKQTFYNNLDQCLKIIKILLLKYIHKNISLQLEIKNKFIHTMIQKITLHINNYFPKN
jgi:hypothetical protein